MRIITLFIDSEPIFEIEKTINRFMSFTMSFHGIFKTFFLAVTIDMLHVIHVNKNRKC